MGSAIPSLPCSQNRQLGIDIVVGGHDLDAGRCRTMKRDQSGQGLVEYALILVLVAIVVIAVMMLLGPVIGNVFSTISNNVSASSGTFIASPVESGSTADYVAGETASDDETLAELLEKIEAVEEAVDDQGEGNAEALILLREVADEGTQALSQNPDVAAIRALIDTGDYAAAAAALADLISGGAQWPVEVVLSIATKTMPLYGQICGHLNDSVVPPELFEEAMAALVAWDPDSPVIPVAQENWEKVQQRSQVAQEVRDGIDLATGVIISALKDSEDPDLVALGLQYEAQTAACRE